MQGIVFNAYETKRAIKTRLNPEEDYIAGGDKERRVNRFLTRI